MNKLLYLLVFTVGGACGSFGTFYYLNKKYQEDFEKEIEEYKQFAQSDVKHEDLGAPEPETSEESDDEVKKQIRPNYISDEEQFAYHNLTSAYRPKEKEETPMNSTQIDRAKLYLDPIRIIEEEEFGTLTDYEVETLTYYDDGLIANEDDELLDDTEEIIGHEALVKLCDPEDDTDVLFVRNDQLLKDFEIIVDGNDCPYAI